MIQTNPYSRPQPPKAYHKSDIAKEQLKTATRLFLLEIDDSSVITLAGAAGNILHQMVINAGKEPFYEYARRVCQFLTGKTPSKQSYTHRINQQLGINAHKHLKLNEHEAVEIDLRNCAMKSLTKAMADYTKLYGSEEDFVRSFFQWAWVTQDGPAIMKEYENISRQLEL